MSNLENFSEHLRPRAEYIWLDANGTFRSKTRTLVNSYTAGYGPSQLPEWTYDGSSTGQAEGKNSEVVLVPVRVCKDPFRPTKLGQNILVWCDIILPGNDTVNSTRRRAVDICTQHPYKEPWFAFEQEYTLMHVSNSVPYAMQQLAESNNLCEPDCDLSEQGPFYCGIGCLNAFGREIAEEHYTACLYAGLDISGINAEVAPGQWEFQIGHAIGVDVGDQLMIARYILDRICEKHNVIPSLDPKPVEGWNGAGCHTNFSTREMRSAGGFEKILEAMVKLEEKHFDHINVYGEGNERRLTGDCETAPMDKFSWGVADRTASIRIPLVSQQKGCGYIEDRRPASNVDPYIPIALLMDTIYGE